MYNCIETSLAGWDSVVQLVCAYIGYLLFIIYAINQSCVQVTYTQARKHVQCVYSRCEMEKGDRLEEFLPLHAAGVFQVDE
jgi:hypothetical protein